MLMIGFFGGAMAMGLLGFVLGPVLLILGITAYEIFIKEGRKKKETEGSGQYSLLVRFLPAGDPFT